MILEVIRAVNIKRRVCRNLALCSLVSGYRISPEIVFKVMVKTTASSKNMVNTYQIGDRGSTVAKVLCYNRKVAGSIPAGVSGFFIDIKSF